MYYVLVWQTDGRQRKPNSTKEELTHSAEGCVESSKETIRLHKRALTDTT